MTRCTEKTLQSKRCKKHASHNGKCLLHIGKVVSETSSETTVEINLPEIDDKKHLERLHSETLNAIVCILSRLTETELHETVEKALERKRILELIEKERT